MEHPFILNLSDKTVEELQEKITELSKKLKFAYGSQNGPMIHQLQMIIESYTVAYNKKINDLISKQNIQTQVKIER